MDFSGITNLSSQVKLGGMKKNVTANAKNGVVGGASPFAPMKASTSKSGVLASLSPQLSEEDSKTLTSAHNKLNAGQELTFAELSVLKDHDPAAYAKAKKAEEESRKYTKELSRCETKDDVRLTHMGKVGEIMSALGAAMERKDLAECARLLERLNMLQKIYNEFTASDEFRSLAENQLELAAERAGEPVETEETDETVESEPSTDETAAPASTGPIETAEGENIENPRQPAAQSQKTPDEKVFNGGVHEKAARPNISGASRRHAANTYEKTAAETAKPAAQAMHTAAPAVGAANTAGTEALYSHRKSKDA